MTATRDEVLAMAKKTCTLITDGTYLIAFSPDDIERIAALLAAPEQEPDAYAIRNDQGYYAGIWNDLTIAQQVLAKGQPSHNEEIIPMIALPPLPKDGE